MQYPDPLRSKMRKLLASAFCSQLRSSLRTRRFRSEVIRFGHVVIHYNVTTGSTGTTSVCSKLLLVFPGCLRLRDTRSTNRKPGTIFLVVNTTSPPRLGGAMSDGFEGLEVVNCLCRKGVTILALKSLLLSVIQAKTSSNRKRKSTQTIPFNGSLSKQNSYWPHSFYFIQNQRLRPQTVVRWWIQVHPSRAANPRLEFVRLGTC